MTLPLPSCLNESIKSFLPLECIWCEREVEKDENECVPFSFLFHITCKRCDGVCESCGCNNAGSPKYNLQSSDGCDFCSKHPCKVCGIVIQCDCCEQTGCPDCIDEKWTKQDKNICPNLKDRLRLLKRRYY